MATGKFNHRSGFFRFNLSAVILITLLPLLLGCRGPSPLQTLYKFDVACMRQDRDEAKKYCTTRYIEERLKPGDHLGGMGISCGVFVPAPPEYIPSYSEFKDDFSVSIVGNTARLVRTIVGPSGGEVVYTMIFTGRGWKLDSMKFE